MLDLFRVGKIAGDLDMVVTIGVVQFLTERAQLARVGTRKRQPRALLGQRMADRRTNPAGGAGYEGGHSGKVEKAVFHGWLRVRNWFAQRAQRTQRLAFWLVVID